MIHSNFCSISYRFWFIGDVASFFGKPEVTNRRFLRQVASQAKYNPGFWKAITDFLLVINSNFRSILYRFWVMRDYARFFGEPEVT